MTLTHDLGKGTSFLKECVQCQFAVLREGIKFIALRRLDHVRTLTPMAERENDWHDERNVSQ